ncbi:MAG: 4-(cytidine 5'-diphospho)-2-C-methyl-D-erythritol kinase, partial [Bacteroidales bacterium]
MQKTLLFPICKINIGLYVVEKRPDGYHNLQTLFYPVGLTDSLEICEPRDRHVPYALYVSGVKNLCAPEDNIVVKTYLALKEEFDLPPVEIFLGKRIPTGAGLGGGSSDAAEMIKGLNERFRLGLTDEDMRRRIARFGADCAFF